MIVPKFAYTSETTRTILLDNSITVKVGDPIIELVATPNIATNTAATVSGATNFILGVVVGFTNANEGVISTGTDPSNFPAQIITTATNTTVNKYRARYIPSESWMVWKADLSAVAGTTTNSNLPFTYFLLSGSTAGQVDETSVKLPNDLTAPLQVLSLGVSSGETSKIDCKIVRSVFNRNAKD